MTATARPAILFPSGAELEVFALLLTFTFGGVNVTVLPARASGLRKVLRFAMEWFKLDLAHRRVGRGGCRELMLVTKFCPALDVVFEMMMCPGSLAWTRFSMTRWMIAPSVKVEFGIV